MTTEAYINKFEMFAPATNRRTKLPRTSCLSLQANDLQIHKHLKLPVFVLKILFNKHPLLLIEFTLVYHSLHFVLQCIISTH